MTLDDIDRKILKELHFPHSLGLLYSAFTYFLGFKVNSEPFELLAKSLPNSVLAKHKDSLFQIEALFFLVLTRSSLASEYTCREIDR